MSDQQPEPQDYPEPVMVVSWDCATHGHLINGIGTSTGLVDVLWDETCERCGEKVKVPTWLPTND